MTVSDCRPGLELLAGMGGSDAAGSATASSNNMDDFISTLLGSTLQTLKMLPTLLTG